MLKRIRTAALEIAYEETGVADGAPVVLLHGFPYDVRAYDGVAAKLAQRRRELVPYLRGYLRGHHTVPSVGHNVPQEAPDAFAAAVKALL
jgi:pimeloyl-ACP methyl ester carboxylesterase